MISETFYFPFPFELSNVNKKFFKKLFELIKNIKKARL